MLTYAFLESLGSMCERDPTQFSPVYLERHICHRSGESTTQGEHGEADRQTDYNAIRESGGEVDSFRPSDRPQKDKRRSNDAVRTKLQPKLIPGGTISSLYGVPTEAGWGKLP